MLTNLRVRDLVLIEGLDLHLTPGFNALTGETGAGKSLVVTALELLLGRRASSELVRRGAGEAEVEGVFDISDEPGVRARLEEAGLPVDNELLIRRVIPADGRHRCYVNGRLSSLGVLASLAEGLASVMGQHEHHSLLDPTSQLALLDDFGGHGALLEEMGQLAQQVSTAAERRNNLRAREQDRAARIDFIQFQVREIDDLTPKAGELDELEREISLLRHQGELLEAARVGADELYESDGSIFERLGTLGRSLDEVARYDTSLTEDARSLAEAAVLVEEAARRLAGYGRNLEADPDQLDQIEERRESLSRLTRKHRTDLDGVLALREELGQELESLSRYEESIAEAEAELIRTRELAIEHAAKLTAARRKTGAKLGRAVTKQLTGLSFEKGRFEVQIEPAPGDPGPEGGDLVELLVALNPGEGTHPLRKVASGGELSRLMLAIRRVTAGVGPVGTYVFDEVDAGVGGAVATSVGGVLAEVASHHQVICITHLPQISGMAGTHFRVIKSGRKGRTVTRVERLDGEERVEELARMIGGDKVTAKARAAAGELITQNRKER
ncbi:MAG: DNA repair protein RecN [Deltaproteobacteria bacterium]|nr:DNA repair protein RecN [Deltaproteobacteria bacterium]